MPQLRLALAQVNPCVGDLSGNTDLVLEWTRRAVQGGAHVVLLPEMVLTGYPVEDLALRRSFAAASRQALDALAGRLAEAGCGDACVVVGYLDHDDQGARNCAAVLQDGVVQARYTKHHLPNYGVFDEFRYFAAGDDLPVLRVHGLDLGIVICEDIWQDHGPVAAYGEAGVDLLLCLNGSPYERSKDDTRGALVARRAAEAGAAIAYVNLVGGQDELVFDGDSMVVNAAGDVLARAPQFSEHLLLVDVDLAAGGERAQAVPGWQLQRVTLSPEPLPAWEPQQAPVVAALSEPAEVWGALVTGLRDYVHKNHFASVVLGLSGGIDSAVVAALAVDALGPDAVHGVSLPSSYSSEHSRSDADDLAKRTGLHYRVEPIAPLVDAFVQQLHLTGLAEENVQARCRGVTLMGLSNAEGHLVLATGNKSELAVGYSTIYGDAVGGFAPIKDVPKTMVWELARWRNAAAAERGETPPIPDASITKEPSAELRPGQLDSDSLPDYAVLDEILARYVEGDASFAEMVADGFDPELVEDVVRKVDRAEYKRRQYPPGTKIGVKAFGRDRRLPLTNSWRERAPEQQT
ncbi:NAD+ synthase [Rhodococcus sp. X156]|uniref:NAD+ synthase n=1 Tax=Rhodococcus sp. X156 TaxID=2499145 RepID=UPI000FDAFB76|nr:NAD+ synthase [Rhodococcus sp. X156]